ncbi:MAG TPA: hypothetical protein VEJ86_07250 [Candidatus Binataceae bacterium]|nr:hypothetical protein [Candidatus Binataceae bacterium]
MSTASSSDRLVSEEHARGAFLTVFAILLAILALSDFTKPLQNFHDPTKGLVFFGMRADGVGINAVAGPLFGIFLAAYAYGMWTMKRWALPLGIIYAFYVPVNLVLFWFLHTDGRPSVRFIVIYLAISLTGSVGTALYLAYHRERLS